MKQKILEWVAGIDANKKDVAKVAGEAVTRLLDLSSRLIFQIPHERDSVIVRGVKLVAIADSVYKCLIKGEDKKDEEPQEEVLAVDPEEMKVNKHNRSALPLLPEKV